MSMTYFNSLKKYFAQICSIFYFYWGWKWLNFPYLTIFNHFYLPQKWKMGCIVVKCFWLLLYRIMAMKKLVREDKCTWNQREVVNFNGLWNFQYSVAEFSIQYMSGGGSNDPQIAWNFFSVFSRAFTYEKKLNEGRILEKMHFVEHPNRECPPTGIGHHSITQNYQLYCSIA